jgi:hypothetical protein
MNEPTHPLISVIMVDGSFRESFHAIDFFRDQTLPLNAFELLWVEYYDKIHPVLQSKLALHPHFRAVALGKRGTYHSSYCFNSGILASQGEVLVIADADVVIERDFLENVWNEHQTNDKLVMYVHRYNEPPKRHWPDINLEHLKKTCVLTNPANYGGCLTVRKKWLLEISGYEQHPVFGTGDHANGRDVYTRLKNLGLDVRWQPQLKLYHPWHEGTLNSALALRLQQIIIDYRAVNLSTAAFHGIVSAKNSDPPPRLSARIEAEKMSAVRDTSARRSFLTRTVSGVKIAAGKVLRALGGAAR